MYKRIASALQLFLDLSPSCDTSALLCSLSGLTWLISFFGQRLWLFSSVVAGDGVDADQGLYDRLHYMTFPSVGDVLRTGKHHAGPDWSLGQVIPIFTLHLAAY